ncbi:MAG: sigma-70 family RNA polymerase sigma factor [Bacteroidota bacterium]|nr:sigma-70 family RNA polymerase sigma factor [Bacteroidota bacterium]
MSSHPQYNEGELLSRLEKGDMQAFDELYWKYQKAVYQNVYKLTRDSVIAEDIVQEVFISLWEKRSTIDTSRSVAGWLFVSSYNRSVNALKKRLKESLAYKSLDQPGTEPEYNKAEIELQLYVLEKAIGQLTPQQRRVFELCKLQGRSYEETAAELKISKHTVKEYLSAAIASLKEFARQHPELSIAVAAMFTAGSLL